MDLLESLNWRYATKQFDANRKVSNETLQRLLEATNLTATSYGLQPFKIVVVSNQAIQDSLVPASYSQTQVAEASHVIVLATRTDVDEAYISQYIEFMESERQLPGDALDGYKQMIMGTIGRLDDSAIQAWALKQVYIALGVLLTTCAIEQVDACPMEGFVAAEYDSILNLSSQNLSAGVVVPIGYRSTNDKYQSLKKVRWPLEKMVVEIKDT